MEASEKTDEAKGAKTVAAIDVGANAVRMVIAEVLPDGRIEVIERLQRAARLGQDAFRRGRLGAASMRVALAILRDFHELLGFTRSSNCGPSPPAPPARPAMPTPFWTAFTWPRA